MQTKRIATSAGHTADIAEPLHRSTQRNSSATQRTVQLQWSAHGDKGKQEAAKKGKRWPYAAAAAIAAVVAAHYYNATVIRSDDLGTGSMFDRIAPHYDKANDFMFRIAPRLARGVD